MIKRAKAVYRGKMWFLFLLLGTCLADTALFQTNFSEGTFRITTPGRYYLAEDISFSPNTMLNAYDSGWVRDDQFVSNGGHYGDAEYTLGFFAVITIEADDVELDLNGHRLEQSASHALLQRFLALIELANSPFLSGQGPHSFTNGFVPARRCRIHNGILGRSAHHGIHGNANVDITIEDILFEGFEVASVALNGVDGLVMRNCDGTNRKDIPVLGTFSSARFIQRYVDYLVDSSSTVTLTVQGTELSAADIRASLYSAINNVHSDVTGGGEIDESKHPDLYALFANTDGLIDGNNYGVLINKLGVAINDFPEKPKPPNADQSASNVRIHNVCMSNILGNIREIVGIRHCSTIATDPVGSVIQLLNTYQGQPLTISSLDETKAEYTGNVAANAQLLVAKAALAGEFVGSGLDTSRGTAYQELIDWVEAGNTSAPEAKLAHLVEYGGWQCNGDSMAHVQKGSVGFKIDGVKGALITDCDVAILENHGAPGSTRCGPYDHSHPLGFQVGYNGATARGMSFAGSEDVIVRRCSVSGVRSYHGDAYGYDVFTDSTEITFNHNDAFHITADEGNSIAYHLDKNTGFSDVKNWCSAEMIAPNGKTFDVWNEGGCKHTIEEENC